MYICGKMARQISIADDVYAMLLKMKGSGSFSDAIRGLFGKDRKKSQKKELMKYFGIWKDWKGAEEFERRILEERRKNMGRKLDW